MASGKNMGSLESTVEGIQQLLFEAIAAFRPKMRFTDPIRQSKREISRSPVNKPNVGHYPKLGMPAPPPGRSFKRCNESSTCQRCWQQTRHMGTVQSPRETA